MQFVRTAIWVAIAVVLVLFCAANNEKIVEIVVWPGIVWGTKIWFPMLISFILGVLPMWAAWRTSRWRLKRRLESTERALASALAPPVPPAGGPPEALPETLNGDLS
jgi:uncharacterized integral membrane protein